MGGSNRKSFNTLNTCSVEGIEKFSVLPEYAAPAPSFRSGPEADGSTLRKGRILIPYGVAVAFKTGAAVTTRITPPGTLPPSPVRGVIPPAFFPEWVY